MNHPHPSDRTHAAFRRPACPEFCRGELVEGPVPPMINLGLSAEDAPYPKNHETNPISTRPTTQLCETNPIKTTPDAIGPPLYLTLTEVGDRPTPKKHETNPIYTRPTTKNAKRTQFHPQRTCAGPKYAKRTQSPPGPRPNYAKRTQFAPRPPRSTPKKCETNPIATRFGFPHDPNTRNEPNLRPDCHPERRAAERSAAAQSRGTCLNTIAEGDSEQTNATPHPQKHETNPISPAADLRRTKKSKRTQFNTPPTTEKHENEPNLHPAQDPNIQNEPNSRTPGVPPPPISSKRTQLQKHTERRASS